MNAAFTTREELRARLRDLLVSEVRSGQVDGDRAKEIAQDIIDELELAAEDDTPLAIFERIYARHPAELQALKDRLEASALDEHDHDTARRMAELITLGRFEDAIALSKGQVLAAELGVAPGAAGSDSASAATTMGAATTTASSPPPPMSDTQPTPATPPPADATGAPAPQQPSPQPPAPSPSVVQQAKDAVGSAAHGAVDATKAAASSAYDSAKSTVSSAASSAASSAKTAATSLATTAEQKAVSGLRGLVAKAAQGASGILGKLADKVAKK